MKRILLLFLSFLFFNTFLYSLTVNLKKGQSKLINFKNIESIEVLNKDILKAIIISNKELLIKAKKKGEGVILVKTNEGDKKILVKVFSKKGKQKMIEVDVQILEIIHSGNIDYGIDWPTLLGANSIDENNELLSVLNIKEENPPLLAFGKFRRGSINIFIDFLLRKNYAKILAKPKLLTLDGKEASFLSGGEIPVVITDTQGHVSTEWKKYGVSLYIKPKIIKGNNIQAYLKAGVSNLDYGNAVKIGISGGVMPAVKKREAETIIEVNSDDTIIIAGLIQNEESEVKEGVPILSLIPLIGEIFTSTHKINKQTELVIFVTPEIINEEI